MNHLAYSIASMDMPRVPGTKIVVRGGCELAKSRERHP